MGVCTVARVELLRALRDRPASSIEELALRLHRPPYEIALRICDVQGVLKGALGDDDTLRWSLTQQGRALLETYEDEKDPTVHRRRFGLMMRRNVGVVLS